MTHATTPQIVTEGSSAVLPAAGPALAPVGAGRRRSTWKRFRRNKAAMFALVWLALMLLSAAWPALIATHDPLKQDVTLTQVSESPSMSHLLGTDQFGRDLFSRVVWGSRPAVVSILVALGIAVLLGVTVGLFAGWLGGRFDRISMWFADVLFAIPLVLLAMAMIGLIGTGLVPAMISVGLLLSARFARLTRAVTLAEREELYLDAARITGLSRSTILGRYLLPNLLPTLIVQLAVMSGAILLVSSLLSFLGVGAPPDSYDWGAMLNAARLRIAQESWLVVPPSIGIVMTVIAFNLFGDGIRDAVGRDTSTNALSVSRRRRAEQAATLPDDTALLSIRDLRVEFPVEKSSVVILENVSIDVRRGETLAVVGESGSGKTMMALAALGLTPAPGGVTKGTVHFDGLDVTNLSEGDWQPIRGKRIGVIFQEPGRTLNPVLTVGVQLMEPLQLHSGLTKKQARARAAELLTLVRVPDPLRRLDEYPHQFSGGMAQRVGIAIALACEPELLIADEPTTALDVTIQGQVLELLDEIRERQGMSMLIITHDLGVVAEVADRVVVMYGGQVMETGTVHDVLLAPRHPYTKALIATMPQNYTGSGELTVIPGMVPSPAAWPSGCRFSSRCVAAVDQCHEETPVMVELGHGRSARCIRLDELIVEPELQA